MIRTQAEKVTKNATSDFDKAVALQDWFRTGGGFTYSLDQRAGSGMDLLAHFVTDDRVGYCEQFASAMAAMGRSLGIPSRVVVGFLDGQPLPDGRILYTSDERHAWPEMYFPGSGWVRFEPTPAQRAAYVPPYTQSQAATQAPTQAPTTAPRKVPGAKPDVAPKDVTSKNSSSFSVPWELVAAVLVLALLLIGPGALRRVQRRRRLRAQDPVHLAEGAWAELGATALDLGLDWPEHRSPREQAGRVTAQVPAGPDEVAALEGLLGEVERGRYAPPSAARHDRARGPLPHRADPGLVAARDGRQRRAPVAGAAVATVAVAARLSQPLTPGRSPRAVGSEAALVATALPALLHALHERALRGGLGGLGPTQGASRLGAGRAGTTRLGATTVDDVEAVRVVVEVEDLLLGGPGRRRRGVPTAPGGQPEGRRAEHHQEPEDTEPGLLAHRATHEHRHARDEHDRRGDRAQLGHSFEGASAQRGDELRVLLGKRLLHLLQQTEFLFGERHVNLQDDYLFRV